MKRVILALAVFVACLSGAVDAQQLQYVSGSGQAATIGQPFAFPWVVRWVDANGNPVAGQEISFRVVLDAGPTTATMDGSYLATIATGADGLAASPIAVAESTVGHGNVWACGPSGPCALFTFQVVTTPAPGSVSWFNMPPQSVEKDKPAQSAWVLQVLDPHGSPLPGVPVTFETDASCGSFSGAQRVDVVTGANGLAPSPLYVGKTAGVFCISSVTAAGAESEPFDTFGMFVFDPRDVTIVGPAFVHTIARDEFMVDIMFTATGNDGAEWPIYGLPVQVRVVDGPGGAGARVVPVTEDELDYHLAHVTLAANGKAGLYFLAITRGPITKWIVVDQRKH